MAATILIEASPWNAATGAVVSTALAGGGSKGYTHRSRNDWQAGVVSLPKFSAGIEFDQNGFSGGARPEFGTLEFRPAGNARLAALTGLLWNGADIEVFTGDDAVGVWTTVIKGVVEEATASKGALLLKVRDSSGDLDVPVAQGRFAGTGGIEGDAAFLERLKRRSWGSCSNVEALPLKASTLVYEVGDPAFPLQAIDDVKDIGRSASAITVVAWAGSIAATFAALEAASVPTGGAAVAPSIACLRWWTQPVGPLTVDLRGEVGSGYVDKAADIAARVMASHSSLTISNQATAAGWRPGKAGLHVDNAGETIAQALDRLLRGSSLAWAANAGGTIRLSQFSFSSPIETLAVIDAARTRTFKPLLRRRVGYRRNHRVHDEGEIASALRDDNGALLTLSSLGYEGDKFGTSSDNVIVDAELSVPGPWTLVGAVSRVVGGAGSPAPGYFHFTGFGVAYPNKSDDAANRVPVIGGSTYYVDAHVRGSTATTNYMNVEVDFYDAAGVSIPPDTTLVFKGSADNTWTLVHGAVTAPATAAKARIVAYSTTAGGGTTDLTNLRFSQSEMSADVTRSVNGPSEVALAYSSGGTLTTALPKTFNGFSLAPAGGAAYTSGVVWSVSVVAGGGSFVGTAPSMTGTGPGSLVINSDLASPEALLDIVGSYGGKAAPPMRVKVVRDVAAASNSGGSSGGTFANDTTLASITGLSMMVLSDDLTVTMGSGGTATLSAALLQLTQLGNGENDVAMVWRRETSPGTWSDVSGSAANSNPDPKYTAFNDTFEDGVITCNGSVSGLTGTQKFRLYGRLASGTSSNTIAVYGEASVQG